MGGGAQVLVAGKVNDLMQPKRQGRLSVALGSRQTPMSGRQTVPKTRGDQCQVKLQEGGVPDSGFSQRAEILAT